MVLDESEYMVVGLQSFKNRAWEKELRGKEERVKESFQSSVNTLASKTFQIKLVITTTAWPSHE